MLAKSESYVKWCRGLTAFTVDVDRVLTCRDQQRTVEFDGEPCMANTRKFFEHFEIKCDIPVIQILRKLDDVRKKDVMKPSEKKRLREIEREWSEYRNVLALCNNARLRQTEEYMRRTGLFQENVGRVTLVGMFDKKDTSALWHYVDPYTLGASRFKAVHFRDTPVSSKRKAVDANVPTTTTRSELKEWLQRLTEVQRRAGVDVALAMTAFLVHELHDVTDGLQKTLNGIPSPQQLADILRKELPVSAVVVAATPALQPTVVPDVASWLSNIAQCYINFQIATGMTSFVQDFKGFDGRCRPLLTVLKHVFPDVATSIVTALDSIGSRVHGDSLVSTLDAFKASDHHAQALEKALMARKQGIAAWASQIADVCPASQFNDQYGRLAAMELEFLRTSFPKMLEGNIIERGYTRQRDLYTRLLALTNALHGQNPVSTMASIRGAGAPEAAWQRRFAMDWKKPVGPDVDAKRLTDQLVALRSSSQQCHGKLRQRSWPERPVVNECMAAAASAPTKDSTLVQCWEWIRCVTYAQSWFANASIWLGD